MSYRTIMDKQSFNDGLLAFLNYSPTPYHAVENIKMMLLESGYSELDERDSWDLEPDEKYFVIRNGGSIIAFNSNKSADGYLMLGAHTDSPSLKIKPNPIKERAGVTQLAVEPYGGLLLNPWFDRDLSIAGKVIYRDTSGAVHEKLLDLKAPVATISSLAIHLDKNANKERSINAQTDILPILTCKKSVEFDKLILAQIDGAAELISHDLNLYDTQEASYIGLEKEFIASARLDNLLSVYLNTIALIQNPDKAMLMVASDHEEVGSDSTSGAGGTFLESVLKRLNFDEEEFAQCVRSSLLISCDNAHAQHPNFMDKHDDNHAPFINEGAVIKVNSNQRYATNVGTIAKLKIAASKTEQHLQEFVTRSDMGCGSTIGPITATRLGIETIDVGIPQFAMHSIRELVGSEDAYAFLHVINAVELED